jgi:hypothetical protein
MAASDFLKGQVKTFLYGRYYQLVSDQTRNVPRVQGRAELVRTYLDSRTHVEIAEEGKKLSELNIINKKNPNGWNNFTTVPSIKNMENLSIDHIFLFGRSFQFILDTNSDMLFNDLIKLDYGTISSIRDTVRLSMKGVRQKIVDSLRERHCYKNGDDEDFEYSDEDLFDELPPF